MFGEIDLLAAEFGQLDVGHLEGKSGECGHREFSVGWIGSGASG